MRRQPRLTRPAATVSGCPPEEEANGGGPMDRWWRWRRWHLAVGLFWLGMLGWVQGNDPAPRRTWILPSAVMNVSAERGATSQHHLDRHRSTWRSRAGSAPKIPSLSAGSSTRSRGRTQQRRMQQIIFSFGLKPFALNLATLGVMHLPGLSLPLLTQALVDWMNAGFVRQLQALGYLTPEYLVFETIQLNATTADNNNTSNNNSSAMNNSTMFTSVSFAGSALFVSDNPDGQSVPDQTLVDIKRALFKDPVGLTAFILFEWQQQQQQLNGTTSSPPSKGPAFPAGVELVRLDPLALQVAVSLPTSLLSIAFLTDTVMEWLNENFMQRLEPLGYTSNSRNNTPSNTTSQGPVFKSVVLLGKATSVWTTRNIPSLLPVPENADGTQGVVYYSSFTGAAYFQRQANDTTGSNGVPRALIQSIQNETLQNQTDLWKALSLVSEFGSVLVNASAILASTLASELTSLRPSQSPAPTHAPSAPPSAFPTVTYQPSIKPSASSIPTATPSFRPSGRPTISARPTKSRPPTGRPTVPPTSAPTKSHEPTQTDQPSALASSRPSLRPSGWPTVFPSDGPSPVPTPRPTLPPSRSHHPTTSPSLGPTLFPTVSDMPSSVPSGSHQPTVSRRPSALPSIKPTASLQPSLPPTPRPSNVPSIPPTLIPSMIPSSRPTPSLIEATQPSLVMVLVGLRYDFSSARAQREWEQATSRHVHRYWNKAPYSPVFMGPVETMFRGQRRLVPANQRRILQVNMTGNATAGNVTTVRNATSNANYPLAITFDQTIHYAFLKTSSSSGNTSFIPTVEQLFTLPFLNDAGPYLDELVNLTGNNAIIVLSSLTAPTAPTPAPTTGGKSDNPRRDRKIIIIVVILVATILSGTAGYIIYLVRKEEANPIAGPLPFNDANYQSDDEDFYNPATMGSSVVGPVQAAVPDPRPEEAMEPIPVLASRSSTLQDPPASTSTVVLPSESSHNISSNGDSIGGEPQLLQVDTERVPTYGTGTTAPLSDQSGSIHLTPDYLDHTSPHFHDTDEENEYLYDTGHPSPQVMPSLSGFQLQIEDLDDM